MILYLYFRYYYNTFILRWTFYYFKSGHSDNWKDNNMEINTITSVEDFWRLFSHLLPVSKIPQMSDYSFFKVILFVKRNT